VPEIEAVGLLPWNSLPYLTLSTTQSATSAHAVWSVIGRSCNVRPFIALGPSLSSPALSGDPQTFTKKI